MADTSRRTPTDCPLDQIPKPNHPDQICGPNPRIQPLGFLTRGFCLGVLSGAQSEWFCPSNHVHSLACLFIRLPTHWTILVLSSPAHHPARQFSHQRTKPYTSIRTPVHPFILPPPPIWSHAHSPLDKFDPQTSARKYESLENRWIILSYPWEFCPRNYVSGVMNSVSKNSIGGSDWGNRRAYQ